MEAITAELTRAHLKHLGPSLFGRVHVRTGLTAGGRPLPDDVGAENPLILKRSVYGDGFLVIFSQINLLLLKFSFSASAGEAQERIRIVQKTQSIRAIDQDNFSGEHPGLAFELGRLFLWRTARLLQHFPAKCTPGQSKQTYGQDDCDRFHSPCLV
jgi:hypothetical protein